MSASWFINVKNKIAIAEVSFIDLEIANNYITMSQNKKLTQQINETINNSDGILFFNRLNVPDEMRNLGYGKKLLKETLSFCEENNYFLINTANNYGNMGQKNLIQFYKNHGMTLVHKSGLLIYHKNLSNNYTIEVPKKIKPY